jgi:asparagine synthase (glutamine-hydrolysing)
MTRFSEKPIKTFSLGYEDELKNKEADLHFARRMSNLFKTDHHEYIMSARELVADVENVIRSFDQPFSGTISTFFLSKLITQHVKVALSGDGADELFGSYLSHRTAGPIRNYVSLRERALAGKLSENEKLLLAPCDIAYLEDLFSRSYGKEQAWRYHLYHFVDKEKQEFLSKDFLQHAGAVSTMDLVERNFANLTARHPLNRILEMEWNTQLPDQVLAFVDFLSMAHSIEVRSPFLDYRLVEFVSTIPGELKIRNGCVKDILKRSVRSLIPEEVIQRPKEGFVLPISDWIGDKLHDYALSVLSEERVGRHGLLNCSVVKSIVNRWQLNPKREFVKIWNLMMFQLWWECYFE